MASKKLTLKSEVKVPEVKAPVVDEPAVEAPAVEAPVSDKAVVPAVVPAADEAPAKSFRANTSVRTSGNKLTEICAYGKTQDEASANLSALKAKMRAAGKLAKKR